MPGSRRRPDRVQELAGNRAGGGVCFTGTCSGKIVGKGVASGDFDTHKASRDRVPGEHIGNEVRRLRIAVSILNCFTSFVMKPYYRPFYSTMLEDDRMSKSAYCQAVSKADLALCAFLCFFCNASA